MTDCAVPWLRSGVGDSPSDGGCIMQVIDWISTNGWSDKPDCVHPILRTIAITINDNCSDSTRQKLLDLAPRLMNTNISGDKLNVQLAIFCAEYVLPLFEKKYPDDHRPRKAIEAARGYANGSVNQCTAAANAAYAANVRAAYAANAANAANAAAAAYAANAATATYAAAAASAATYAYDFLVAVLDKFDELTGRSNVELSVPDFSELVKLMA